MKLDWDCVRELLIAAEALNNKEMVHPGTIKGWSEDVIIEHIKLLTEAGLVEGYPKTNPMFIERLTWNGHQLLAILRSQSLWERIKAEAKDRSLSLSFEIIRVLANKLIGV